MRSYRSLPCFTVSEKGQKSIEAGHVWVYRDELTAVGDYENGQICDVVSEKGKYLGSGFINDGSTLMFRLISRNANDKFDRAFFSRRIRYSLDYRKMILNESEQKACRLVFSDSDGLPGLTVDRFNGILSVQITTLGMELRREQILSELVTQFAECFDVNASGTSVFLRADSPVRENEGLELYKSWYSSPADGKTETVIEENGVRFAVDVQNGQKTGFFLDQKFNRAFIQKISRGRKVLDCCTHTGAFALNAAAGGAERVTAVDISSDALQIARTNAGLNGFENVEFVRADVFDQLKNVGRGEYDLIILDPPAFTKRSGSTESAYRGYRELNTLALRKLRPGSLLATASCSHHMNEGLFKRMIGESAAECSAGLKQIYFGQQSPDHPILWGVPESYYLKFFVFQIV